MDDNTVFSKLGFVFLLVLSCFPFKFATCTLICNIPYLSIARQLMKPSHVTFTCQFLKLGSDLFSLRKGPADETKWRAIPGPFSAKRSGARWAREPG